MNRKPIQILSNELANMISAGEVVERPVSVVKELVENAVDAEATSIKIELLDSGLKYISVSDNGIGMLKDEIPIALKRHATSKIATKIDLFSISSLGFRGEALPSIASVSKMRITSSTDGITGYFYEFINLNINDSGYIAAKKGTKIEVEDLFYNTPARYKHLSNLTQELSNIMLFVNRLAIAYPNIAFFVTNNNKTLLQTNGGNLEEDTFLNVMSNVYGNDVAKNLIPFKGKNSLYSIEGYTTKNSVFRSNKNYINIIVNDRIIRNQQLVYAITDAYKTILPVGKYPITVLKIDTDPTLIDVNAHPSKLEIRFTEEYELRKLISQTLEQALHQVDLVYTNVSDIISEDNFQAFERQIPSDSKTQTLQKGFKLDDVWSMFEEEKMSVSKNNDNDEDDEKDDEVINEDFDFSQYDVELTKPSNKVTTFQEETDNYKESFEQTKLVETKQMKFQDLQYIGQYNKTYLLFEYENDLYLIDQHAGMERFMYEKILHSFNDNKITTYELLVPINIELTSSELIIIENKIGDLEKMGFSVEVFSNTSILFRVIPTWIPNGLEMEFIHDIVNHLLTNQKTGKAIMYDSLAKKLSCKKSIKANMGITTPEVNELLKKLDQCHMPFTCPHGRPTLIKITKYEIEKMFKRVM